ESPSSLRYFQIVVDVWERSGQDAPIRERNRSETDMSGIMKIAALFGVAALGVGVGAFSAEVQNHRVEQHKWRTAVSDIARPGIMLALSEQGNLAPSSTADNCVIDSLINAVADEIAAAPQHVLVSVFHSFDATHPEKLTAMDLRMDTRFHMSADNC